MTDTNDNLTLDISGNTASVATDYGHPSHGLTAAHVPLQKLVWGDDSASYRTSLTNPLPIQWAGATGPVDMTGNVSGQTGSRFPVTNVLTQSGDRNEFLAVAGDTAGLPLGVSGAIQGLVDGYPLGICGSVSISGMYPENGAGADWTGVQIQGVTCIGGSGTITVAGESYGVTAGFGIPIAITAGRRLDSSVDSVAITGTVGVSGGKDLTSATDSVSCFGHDQGRHVFSKVFASDGTTLGASGEYLKVWMGGADINASVTVSSVHGVTNSTETPLRVQGFEDGTGHSPVVIKGENAGGAIDIFSTNSLSTSVDNVVEIQDDDIINHMKDSDKPLINTLNSIKTGTDQISPLRTDLKSGNIQSTILEIKRPASLRSGSKTATATAQPLSNNLELKTGVTLKSSPSNTGNILIGGRGLVNSSASGYLLEPGESIYLEVNNLKTIYVKSDNAGDSPKIYYIGS